MVHYSLSKDVDGNVFVDITEDIFDATNGESVARTIQRVIAEKFDNLIDANRQKIRINKTTNDEFRRSKSATDLLKNQPQAYNDKLKTIANADEILSAAKNWIGEKIKHERNDDIVEFARGNIMYRVGETGYVAYVIVGTKENGSAVLYDLVNIYDKKIAEAPVTMASIKNSQRRQDTPAGKILTQPSEDVNPKENVFTENEARALGLQIDEHTHYHGLGEKFFLQVIDGLDNVKEAYRGTKNAADSSRRESYFLLVFEFKDQDGNVINVPVYIDKQAQINRVDVDVNKISTVFGRDAFREYINRQIGKKSLSE